MFTSEPAIPEVIMFNSRLIAKKIALGFVIALIATLALASTAAAQTQDPAERQRAIDVYESQNMIAALPLLEKVAVAYPNDPIVLSRLGFALYANSVDEKDAAARQKMRARARSVLLKSQALRDNRTLTTM